MKKLDTIYWKIQTYVQSFLYKLPLSVLLPKKKYEKPEICVKTIDKMFISTIPNDSYYG